MVNTRVCQRAAHTIAILIGICGPLSAQTGPGIRQPHAGDCAIVLELPEGTDGTRVQFRLNTHPLTILAIHGTPLVAALRDPLVEGDQLRASIDGRDYQATVAALLTGSAGSTACSPELAPVTFDARNVFEASAYLGTAFDNFAPNVVGNYQNPAAGTSIKSRWIAGVEAQYRLWSSRSNTRQFWLGTKTLHGVRTADVNCEETPSVAVCNRTAANSDKFLFILEHASTIEAHLDPRFEFMTLQPDSEVPTKVYVTARFGFLDVENAPKVFNSDSIGVGLLAPKGTFKDSLAQVAWGRSAQFQSNPGWNRLKINGLLVFDVMAPLRERLEFWKRLAGSSRVFVEISVDRNPGGPGPDSVQSYVGIDFDLRNAFSGFR